MPIAGRTLRRLLPTPRTGPLRLTEPVSRRPVRCAAVADHDLDTGVTTVHEPITPYSGPPEAVHALVWWHGAPLGEVTVLGPPAQALAALPAAARRDLVLPLVQHGLDDALRTPHGLCRAAERGLFAVPHPPEQAHGPGPTPTVTVAVCTRDRPEALARCLTAVAALRGPVLEIVVVDNAPSDDRTRQVVAAHPGVRYVVEPLPGLDRARNRALLEARGEVVAFTDDDVLVHPGWVEGLRTAFREEPSAQAVTGLVVPAELATPAQVLFETRGGFGRGFRRLWYSAAVDAGEVASAVFGGTGQAGTGANMAFRREPLLALGGFDPALDVGTATGGGGDLEAFFRVVAAGGLLVYEPSAVVRHQHRPGLTALRDQMRGFGTGSYAYQYGAGHRYGVSQYRSFLRLGLSWGWDSLVRGYADSLDAPEALPPQLKRAEARGALDAVLGGYYGRARRAAQRQPGPVTAPLVHQRARPAGPRTADHVIDVQLDHGPVSAPDVPTGARRVRVRVRRGGVLEHVLTVRTRGSALTAARLRRALVDGLGPALMSPGLAWDGAAGEPGVADPPVQWLAGMPPMSAGRLSLCAHLLEQGAPRDDTLEAPLPSVTVLLCTRDRPALLGDALALLDAELRGRRDVDLVVVDNSTDPSATRAALTGLPYAHVVHEPRPGLSRARNTGLAQCTGEVVAMLDDDVLVQPGWLDGLLRPFAARDVAVVTGAVLPADLDDLEAQVFEDYGGLHRGPHRRSWSAEWLDADDLPPTTWVIGGTASAAFRRLALVGAGGFLEGLGAGTSAGVGEDTECFYRLLRAGGRIVYEPTARVLHRHRATREELAAQLRAYAAGHVAYHLEVAVRHGDRRGLRRVGVHLPLHFARQLRSIARGHEDFPAGLVRAQLRGHLAGPCAWGTARRSAR